MSWKRLSIDLRASTLGFGFLVRGVAGRVAERGLFGLVVEPELELLAVEGTSLVHRTRTERSAAAMRWNADKEPSVEVQWNGHGDQDQVETTRVADVRPNLPRLYRIDHWLVADVSREAARSVSSTHTESPNASLKSNSTIGARRERSEVQQS